MQVVVLSQVTSSTILLYSPCFLSSVSLAFIVPPFNPSVFLLLHLPFFSARATNCVDADVFTVEHYRLRC